MSKARLDQVGRALKVCSQCHQVSSRASFDSSTQVTRYLAADGSTNKQSSGGIHNEVRLL